MNDKSQIIIQPEAQKAIEEAYFWFSNISHQKGRKLSNSATQQ